MFERYSEKARRVLFFARYEASNYGSPSIETEHLLLGLLKEDIDLANRLAQERIVGPEIRAEIEKRIVRGERFSTSVEVPLSQECNRVLKLAGETADRLGHHSIETEHLLVGIMRVENCLAAQVLTARGVKPKPLQEMLKAPQTIDVADATVSGLVTLEAFLAGLKWLKSDALMDYFAKNAEFIDISGRRRSREDISSGFDTLFAHYAKKNAACVIEKTLAETSGFLVAVVLWKNALLASEERIWIHRMSVILAMEAGEWRILLLQVTAVQTSSHT